MKALNHAFLLCFIFALTACTRKTPPLTGCFHHAFQQGSADSLYCLPDFKVLDLKSPPEEVHWEDLEDNILTIKTAETGDPVKISTSSERVKVDSQVSFVNQYYLLNYTLVTPPATRRQKLLSNLLSKIKNFKGFPNTVYRIIPYLRNNYLILYRVGEKSKIPYDEYSSGVKVNHKLMATPLVGYKVRYCTAEVIKNANNEKTGQYRPKCDVLPQEAEYISFQKNNKQMFTYQPKVNIFPSDFFDGRWFFTWTVVASSERSSTNAGEHVGMTSAQLIEFKKEPGRLLGIDASGIDMADKDKTQALSIPVSWKEYEIKTDSDIIYSFGETEAVTKAETKRPYFKILFNTLLGGRNSIPLKEVVITDNFFSYNFDVVRGLNLKTIKVAFKKENPAADYEEKQWIEEDSQKFFPNFAVIRAHYQDVAHHTPKERDRYFRIARFNPKSKVIKWHFSTDTPESAWVRSLGRKAADLWNKAFEKASEGTGKAPIQIVLDESQDQKLGDTRFNILNLIKMKEEQKSGLYGIGPNVANPVTGEVISGTANVYVSQVVDHLTHLVRQYIRFHVFPPVYKLVPSSKGMSKFLHEKVQKFCPEVQQFIQTNQGSDFHPESTELSDNAIVQDCAHKLARQPLLCLILHEMGHTFSLRHVFSASADQENFYTSYDDLKTIYGDEVLMDDATPSYQTPAHFSSVMDYNVFDFPCLAAPGKYDIAALRFIHYDMVETKDGQLIEAAGHVSDEQSAKSILETAKEKNTEIKHYEVCGGGRTGDLDMDNPLCQMQDYGSEPVEVVNHLIASFKNTLTLGFKRYDSAHISTYHLPHQYILTQLNSFLAKWREKRMEIVNQAQLFKYTPANTHEYTEILEHTAGQDPEFKKYYEVRNLIMKFFKEFLMIPTKKCLFKKPDGSYYSIALGKIGRLMTYQYSKDGPRAVLANCQSPVVEAWAADNHMEFFTEVGFIGAPSGYLIPPKPEDKLDELSVFDPSLRGAAFSQLAVVLNEPDFKWKMLDDIQQYLLKGMDLRPYITDPSLAGDINNSSFPERFLSYEEDYLSGFGGPMSQTLHVMDVTHALMSQHGSPQVKSLMHTNMVCRGIGFLQITDIITPSFQKGELTERYPFLYELYQEFTAAQKPRSSNQSFLEFLSQHPNVYQFVTQDQLCIPFSKDTFLGRFTKIYKQYKQCIENHAAETPCEYIDDKTTFVTEVSKIAYRDQVLQ